jgi:hypothetical protein
VVYRFENRRLKPLKIPTHEALQTKSLENTLLVCNRIEEMTSIVAHKQSAILLHSKNRYSLFLFCWFQFKARTRKEFRTILYSAPKDLLYYGLKAASFLSFGYYRLIFYKGGAR